MSRFVIQKPCGRNDDPADHRIYADDVLVNERTGDVQYIERDTHYIKHLPAEQVKSIWRKQVGEPGVYWANSEIPGGWKRPD